MFKLLDSNTPQKLTKLEIVTFLISQQFYKGENKITDRTRTIEVTIENSSDVIENFKNFLLRETKDLEGLDVLKYKIGILSVSKKLNMSDKEKSSLEAKFDKKTVPMMREGVATEDILYLTSIASILEILDMRHLSNVLKDLSKQFFDKFDKDKTFFQDGINRLGEVADSNFSLLINIEKINDLSRLFTGKKLYLNPEVKQKFIDNVLIKIYNEEY